MTAGTADLALSARRAVAMPAVVTRTVRVPDLAPGT